jgi:capsular polysaccharide transport system permease protein
MPVPPAQTPKLAGQGVSRKFRMARIVAALMLREMSTRYGRSPGGYLWAILEPLGMIALLSIGFSLLLRVPPLGTSFVLFFATGFVPFNLYQNLATMIARALIFSKALLAYPVVTWADAIIARFLLNGLTGILVSYAILGIVLLAFVSDPVSLDIGPVLLSMSLAILVGLAVGTLNCALTGLNALWGQVWTILTRPLFIASGVIFLYENMPPLAQQILWYNPLLHVIGLMRTGFYPSYIAAYISVPYVVGFSLVVLFFGVVLLGRYHRDILNN